MKSGGRGIVVALVASKKRQKNRISLTGSLLLPGYTLCRVMRQSTLLCGFSTQAVNSVVASEMDCFM